MLHTLKNNIDSNLKKLIKLNLKLTLIQKI